MKKLLCLLLCFILVPVISTADHSTTLGVSLDDFCTFYASNYTTLYDSSFEMPTPLPFGFDDGYNTLFDLSFPDSTSFTLVVSGDKLCQISGLLPCDTSMPLEQFNDEFERFYRYLNICFFIFPVGISAIQGALNSNLLFNEAQNDDQHIWWCVTYDNIYFEMSLNFEEYAEDNFFSFTIIPL